MDQVLGASAPGLGLEDPDELLADDPPLLLGVCDSLQPLQESFPGLDHDEVHPQVPEGLLDGLGLVHPHEAVVHVDGHQPVSQGPRRKGGRHAGVDAPAEGDYGLRVSDSLADLLDGFLDEVHWLPVLPGAADDEHEIGEHLLPPPRVDHLGVPLEAVEGSRPVPEGGDGGDLRVGEDLELV